MSAIVQPPAASDQHGTAIVVLAALLNALVVVGKRFEEIRVVVTGAGQACSDILLAQGVRDIVVCEVGGADELLAGADVLIGLSAPGTVSAAAVRTMAPDAIVFALADPLPEVMPEEIRDAVAIVATRLSDYPNQINPGLAFPGELDDAMKLAAARAIAGAIGHYELDAEHIVASPLRRELPGSVG